MQIEDTMPAPPRLHWGWVLALSIITNGFFGHIWIVVQSRWSNKVCGNGYAIIFAILNLCFYIAYTGIGFISRHVALPGFLTWVADISGGIAALIQVGFYYAAIFVLRDELQKEPIGLPLGPFLTFFFGTWYFQHSLQDYGIDTRRGPLNLSAPDESSTSSSVPE